MAKGAFDRSSGGVTCCARGIIIIIVQSYGQLKRRKNFPLLLILIGISIVACGLYSATYFQAVAANWRWRSSHYWFSRCTREEKQERGDEEEEGMRSNCAHGLPSDLIQNNPSQSNTQQMNYSHSSHGGGWGGSGGDESEEAERLACQLPKLDPMDKSIIAFIKPQPDIDCQESSSYPLIFRTDFRSTLIQVKHFDDSNIQCCYRTVQRGNFSDRDILFSKECFRISGPRQVIPAEHEFIYIRCKNVSSLVGSGGQGGGNETTPHPLVFREMFAFVPSKPETESRVRAHYYRKMRAATAHARVGRPLSSRSLPPGTEDDGRLSVVILGLDAQSHMNFLRQMPLTSNYLIQNLSAISLDGYTKVSDNTFPNVIPLLTGLNVSELKATCWRTRETPFDDCPFIWKEFARRGYRTSFAEDSVWMGAFNYNKPGFLRTPTDYYLHPLTDLMAKTIGHHSTGNSELCYGPRLGFEVLLDYIVKTAVTFGETQRYFQFVWANSLFHDYLNHPRLGDRLLYLTFEFLHRNGYLNRTMFLLLSDHGIRWGAIRTTYQGKIEERMPLAYIVFPHWFHKEYPLVTRTLRLNSKRLTTPFDLHELLKDVLNQSYRKKGLGSAAGKGSRGLNLFHLVPRGRTCQDAQIAQHWCVCDALVSLHTNSSVVTQAAAYLVQRINSMLSGLMDYCAELELSRVYEARRTIPSNFDEERKANVPSPAQNHNSTHSSHDDVVRSDNDDSDNGEDSGSGDEDYKKRKRSREEDGRAQAKRLTVQVTIVTTPGDAMFEATLAGTEVTGPVILDQDYNWQLAGDISRINLYGSQSTCISNFILQKYCFCLNLTSNNSTMR